MELWKGLIPTPGGSLGERAKGRPGGMDLDHVLREGAWPGQMEQRTRGGEGQGVATGYCWKDGRLLQGDGAWLKGVKACRSGRLLLVHASLAAPC